jgi:hypothetical protein
MTEVLVQEMVPAAMVSLRKKVQAWRAQKKHRRMPDELWTEAVRLALEYGVHPVAKNVAVSYTRLKKLVDGKMKNTWRGNRHRNLWRYFQRGLPQYPGH